MATGSWDIIVRAFFADGGLSAGLAKANAQLDLVRKTGPGARAGLKAVEIGARQLAFEAAGLTGGIGQLARGLLQFGGGSALMLAAVAGIGAVAFAYRALTKDSREAAEQQKKLREELHRVAEAAREARLPGTERIAGQQGSRQARFAELNAQINDQLALIRSQVGPQRFDHETEEQALQRLIAGNKELNNLYSERRKLGQDIRSETVSSADAAKKEADELARAAEEARRLKLEAIQFLQAQIQLEKGGVFRALPISFTAPGFGAGGLAPGPSVTTFGNIRSNVPRFVPGETPKPPSHLMEDLRAAQMMAMSLMMMRGGGVGGALGGIGGILGGAAGFKGLGMLGPIGFGLSALGSVFSIFDRSEERRHRELIRSIERIGQEVGLERVTVVFTGPDGHQIRRSLAELESSDAVERVPGPVGVSG